MEKICTASGDRFRVSEKDRSFYASRGVPIPTLCPEERQRRRLAWRNESHLYWRQCDGSGERILSVFSADKPYRVYDYDYWISDQWNPLDYGRDFDFSRPFFDQFAALLGVVPQVARSAFDNTDSPYINQAGQNKRAYMIFEADYTTDCAYSWHITDSDRCLDCDYVERCHHCYGCVSCLDCRESRFLQNCAACTDSWFLKNCTNCEHCFGSVNLENKKFYFKNKSLTEAAYWKALADLDLGSARCLESVKLEIESFFETVPHPHCNGFDFSDSTGDYLYNTQNCQDSYFLVDSVDARFVSESRNVKRTYDMDAFGSRRGVVDCYEVHEIGGNVSEVMFSEQIWHDCSRITYSKLCINGCQDLFGCIGLQGKRYCIFNTQYTADQYYALRAKIIAHMKKTGEWGEYFPAQISPFGYNETVAQEYYPLFQKEAAENGFNWFQPSVTDAYRGPEHLAPDSIRDADLTICDQILNCRSTGENYRILQAEYNFYKTYGLPLPSLCPMERHRQRDDLRNRRRLHDRNCDSCQVALRSTYGPQRSEQVLCSDCYKQVVE